MTTAAGSIEQKVRQLDNDVHAIYELIFKISTTQVRHTNRFEEITEDLAEFKGRLEAVEGRLGAVEGKLDRVLEILER